MALVILFLLLPESNPSNLWMYQCCQPDHEDSFDYFTSLISELSEMLDTAILEKYQGFYDSENVSNFLHAYTIVEEYYPSRLRYILRKLIADNCCNDWRETTIQTDPSVYRIFRHPVYSPNTLCEIAARKLSQTDNNFALLNIRACNFQSDIEVEIDGMLKSLIHINFL